MEKPKAMKISISGANLTDAMFPHQNRRVGIVKKISHQLRNLGNNLSGDFGMPFRRNKHPQSRGSEKRRNKAPCLRRVPRLLHYAWMGGDAQKLVQYAPGDVPGVGAVALSFEPIAAGGVE